MLRILLMDHRPLMFLGLRTLLEHVPDMTLIYAQCYRQELVQFASQHLPDVYIINTYSFDAQLQEKLRDLANVCPSVNVLLVVESYDVIQQDVYWAMEKLNLKGIIANDESIEEWAEAMYAAGAGRLWFSARFPVRLLFRDSTSVRQPIHLTQREGDVCRLVLAGLPNRQIANHLSIAERTVEFHLSNAMQKFHVSSRVGLLLAFQQSDPVVGPEMATTQ